MSAAKSSLAITVRVTQPRFVSGHWDHCWWDAAHQHIITLKSESNTFSLWRPDGPLGTSMQLFQYVSHKGVPLLARGEKSMLCKLSVDLRLLALQTSDTSLSIYDIQSQQSWKVAIKSPYDNRIIAGGIIWSEHSGGSQDLIIVTLRGLELWKVSPQRGNCKLSRTVSQGYAIHAHFWYEPNFRCIVLASPLKQTTSSSQMIRNMLTGGGSRGVTSSSSTATGGGDGGLASLGKLALNGYFFKISKEKMPKLELPPPDKTPRLEVDAGSAENDIAMLTLYSSLYLAVRSQGNGSSSPSTSDVLNLYRLHKTTKNVTSVTLTHVLALGGIHLNIRISVTDNLLLLHYIKAKTTQVYDIRSSTNTANVIGRSTSANTTTATGDVVMRVSPVCPAASIVADQQWGNLDDITAASLLENSKIHQKHAAAATATTASSLVSRSKSDGVSNNDSPASSRSNSIDELRNPIGFGLNKSSADASQKQWHDQKNIRPNAESLLPGHEDTLSLMQILSEVSLDPGWDHVIPFGHSSNTSVDIGAGHTDLQSAPLCSHQKRLQEYCANPTDIHACSILYGDDVTAALPRNAICTDTSSIISSAISGGSRNSGSSRFTFLEPSWIYDKVDRLLWRLRPCLGDITNLTHDPRSRIGFLLHRGLPFRAERPVYFYNQSREDSLLAKSLILHVLGSCIENRASFSFLEAIFQAISRPYAAVQASTDTSVYPSSAVSSAVSSPGGMGHISRNGSPSPRETPEKMVVGGNISSVVTGAVETLSLATLESASGSKIASLSIASPLSKKQENNDNAISTSISTSAAKAKAKVADSVFGSASTSESKSEDTAITASTYDSDTDNSPTRSNGSGSGSGGATDSLYETMLSYGNTVMNAFVESTQAALIAYGERLMGSQQADELDALETKELLQSLLADITLIGGRRHRQLFGLKGFSDLNVASLSPQATAAAFPLPVPFTGTLSPLVPLGTRRDLQDNLIVTQTELISHIWLPLLLVNECQIDFDYIAYAIMLSQSVLRGCGADTHPVTSLCLLKTLAAQTCYMEIGRLLQLQFFPDSPEVGIFALDLCDAIDVAQQQQQQNNLETWFVGGKTGMRNTVRTLRQVGLDMLWRIGEKPLVVRWLLAHGRAIDAMRLCSPKHQGQWQNDLGPRSVSGIDFFDGVISTLNNNSNRAATNAANTATTSSSDNGIGDESAVFGYAERIGIVYSLYRFILKWDPQVLEQDYDTVATSPISSNAPGHAHMRGQSRLASSSRVGFPRGLLRISDVNRFRSMFGFPDMSNSRSESEGD